MACEAAPFTGLELATLAVSPMLGGSVAVVVIALGFAALEPDRLSFLISPKTQRRFLRWGCVAVLFAIVLGWVVYWRQGIPLPSAMFGRG